MTRATQMFLAGISRAFKGRISCHLVRSWSFFVLLVAVGAAQPLHAGDMTITYTHTDVQGNVIAVTDQDQNVIERRQYEPYGLPQTPINDDTGYTGHLHDGDTGLVYMQQRYYDPKIGQFLSVDPVLPSIDDGSTFNRYWYANDNPYRFVDPNGEIAIIAYPVAIAGRCAINSACRTAVTKVAQRVVEAVGGAVVANEVHEEISGDAGNEDSGNTNPYDGPVDEPVIVVDSDGNAIPVESGEQIGASPDGEYQQVKDSEGNQTGTRLDKGGHPSHADPKAQGPHGHRPDVTDESGNPHLPVNSSSQDPEDIESFDQ